MHRFLSFALMLCAAGAQADEFSTSARTWPAFRGDGTSALAHGDLPLEWAARGRKNFAWNVRLPGYGQSSPVAWNSRVFVTAVDGEEKEKLLLVSIDLESGQKMWQRDFAGTQRVPDGDAVSRGAPTPAVDAGGVYALYESGDLFALSHAGEELWKRSLVAEYGEFQGPHGYASSLAQTDESLIVQVSHRGPSYLLSLDKATGRNRWKIDLPSATSWASPVVVRQDSQRLVLLSASGLLMAVDAAEGLELWRVTDLQGNAAPSPTTDGKLVVVGSSEPGFTRAYRLGGAGDVSQSHLAWTADKATCSYGSPLIHGGCVYLVSKTGVATCLDLASGVEQWSERLPGACWATPLAADERVYFFTKDGVACVFQIGDSPQRLAENEISFTDVVYGVAAVEGSLLIRSGRGLACVTNRPAATPAAVEPAAGKLEVKRPSE